jgi:hypothetical protein
MANKDLVNFIKEARRRGYSNPEIKKPLLKKGWPRAEVESAFLALKPKSAYKNRVCLYLDNDVLKVLGKRAKKNLFTIPEQVEDIIRRSCVSQLKKKSKSGKIDDLLVSIFSKRKYKKR